MKKLLAAFALSAAVLTAAAVPAAAATAPAAPTVPTLNFVTAKQCTAAGGKVVSGLSLTGQLCKGGKSDGAWVIPDFPSS